uniref:Uncharacterized protein n=1 Tax=Romanomermis culicivorax TaxID=13658 RepID=A0A915KYX0_ROMCU
MSNVSKKLISARATTVYDQKIAATSKNAKSLKSACTNKVDRLESEVFEFWNRNEKFDSIPDKYSVDIFVCGRKITEFAGDYVELRAFIFALHPTYKSNRKFVIRENRDNKPPRCMTVLAKLAFEQLRKRIAHFINLGRRNV